MRAPGKQRAHSLREGKKKKKKHSVYLTDNASVEAILYEKKNR